MKKSNLKWLIVPGLIVLVAGCANYGMEKGEQQGGMTQSSKSMSMGDMPFGDPESVKYSQSLWSALEKSGLAGANARPDGVYQGTHPHGAMLETLNDRVTVKGHDGEVIVKRNYGGPGINASKVSADRKKWLKAVTVMYKREPGYDAEDQDWFWVKYKPDGSLFTNPKGMKLAGRVAKGMTVGCISCHKAAPGGDMMFTR